MPSSRTTEQQLGLFVRQVEKVRARRIFANGLPKIELRLGVGPNGQMLLDVPDEDDLQAFMVDFRPFTLNNEDVNFNRITNILHLKLTDNGLRDANAANKAGWKQAFEGSARFTLVSNSTGAVTNYVARDFFDLVINGKMFHHDPSKATEYDALPDTYQVLAQFAVNELVLEAAQILHLEANLIRQALERKLVALG